jgi:hypothetical protein
LIKNNLSERNNVRTNYFLFHSRFAFLGFGDGAKKENEKISKSKPEDNQDFNDLLSDKGHNDMDDYGDDQPINTVFSNGAGTSKFIANS